MDSRTLLTVVGASFKKAFEDRKASLIVFAIFVVLAGGYLFWRWWHGGHPDMLLQEYQNARFTYALDYPIDWHMGYLGDSAERAEVIWLVSDPEDVELKEGGLPNGVMVEVVVQDLETLAGEDPSLLEIKSATDWLKWKRSQNGDSDDYEDKPIEVAGKPAIKTTYTLTTEDESSCEQVPVEGAGPWLVVVMVDADSRLVYQIEYLGRQPVYDANLSHFEGILASFRLL